MKEFLIKNGFIESNSQNEYIKNDWTIRLDDNKIEVFNNPDISKGLYYLGFIEDTDIEYLISEIIYVR